MLETDSHSRRSLRSLLECSCGSASCEHRVSLAQLVRVLLREAPRGLALRLGHEERAQLLAAALQREREVLDLRPELRAPRKPRAAGPRPPPILR